jgi:hypothetical protein
MADYEDRPLIGYLPNVLKSVREYKALMSGEQPEIFSLFEEIQNALNNEFVVTSTEYGVGRWEKILGIIPNLVSESLPFRRKRILICLQTILPFTEEWLKQKIEELFGADDVTFGVDYNDYKVSTTLHQADMNLLNEVKLLYKKVIPANMQWRFEIVELLLDSTLWVGLNLTPRIETRQTFDLVPDYYPLQGNVYVGVLHSISEKIKFEME